ncbi:MAG: (2Fe-2S)-binding protein, partial [Lachnospiraceae bacterium]|nr:(2Fe-2S)-binding protein [Lachnospiraceae bacterium]
MVNLTIDNKPVTVADGTTILEAARKVGINIPTLCYLKEINEIGACRICVVEVEGVERCVTACNTVVTEGMVIHTNSAKARTTRKTNVKLILSQHKTNCTTCVRSGNCTLQTVANDLNITKMNYDSVIEEKKWDRKSPLIRDASKCVK